MVPSAEVARSDALRDFFGGLFDFMCSGRGLAHEEQAARVLSHGGDRPSVVDDRPLMVRCLDHVPKRLSGRLSREFGRCRST